MLFKHTKKGDKFIMATNNPVIKTYAFCDTELSIKEIVFTTSDTIPNNADFIDFSENKDMSIVGWYNEDKTILYVAPAYGDKIIANPDSESMFFGCEELEKITGLEMLDTSNVYNMLAMFAECLKLKTLDLSSFNTKNVKNMERMFVRCSELESINLSSFDTSNVTSTSYMFAFCKKLQTLDLTNFNVDSIYSAYTMFYGCEKMNNLKVGAKFITELL